MKKIDRVVEAFRKHRLKEEGMVANAPGGSGGFSSSAAAKGPVAGFDPVMGGGMGRRKKPQIKMPPGQRKRWKT